MANLLHKNLTAPVTPQARDAPWLQRLRKLGVVCFLFFLIKGLLWLAIPAALVFLGNR